MTAVAKVDWTKDFGLDNRNPPHFFSRAEQLETAAGKVPQIQTLRRAFEQLEIDGILCQDRVGSDGGLQPVIYFRQVEVVDSDEIIQLRNSFWNQGIAPILVIIAPDDVHIYSGLISPADTSHQSGQVPGFVETISRVSDSLRAFLLSVESGEYFHVHRRSFDPRKRVDRYLLQNLRTARQQLGQVQSGWLEPHTLDVLLCRLIFSCYLFDRGIIDQSYLATHGIQNAAHLKDILAKIPRDEAKADLYKMFSQLAIDFNGDLFDADLDEESKQLTADHFEIIDRFFHGTDVASGQTAFWAYDFGFIPIETISSIYEHFLKAAGKEKKKETGAFYTPRFLAEFALDVALEGDTSLLDRKFLDPACGSGIFLVGIFNRIAEEWKLKNPDAQYDHHAKCLMGILRTNIFGVDSSPSACQVTAFSLYLAFLDQLSPPDIQKLLGKWDRLPHLVFVPGETAPGASAGTIRCADFFTDNAALPQKVHVIVGNPPWGSAKDLDAPIVRWCAERNLPHPDRQKATAFIWKAPMHLEDGGTVCFVLPHGTLFNHNDTAIRFQQSFFLTHAVDRVVNLTDFQFFLFEESRAPALIVRYHEQKPRDSAYVIDYWAPKTDWAMTQAEIVSILPQDRSRMTIREVLDNLTADDEPLIWKTRFWATPRDWRLVDRLSLLPKLNSIVSSPSDKERKRWIIGQGFEQRSERALETKKLILPTTNLIEARDSRLRLFLLASDCDSLPSNEVTVRKRSNTSIEAYLHPHVLVTKGFKRSAFADFDVAFRHALRGIHGPEEDRNLLLFLAAYLQTDLAGYFLFHTSSNWGVSRAEVHVEELLRLPFPLPDDTNNPKRSHAIVHEIAAIVTKAADEASRDFSDRKAIVRSTEESIGNLIEEYFDIDDVERMLVADTTNIIIPSVRPSRGQPNVPTIKHSSSSFRASYTRLLCDRLNHWAQQDYRVHGETLADSSIGVGMVVLQKVKRGERPTRLFNTNREMLKAIQDLQKIAAENYGTYDLVRGAKVFHDHMLYITKPLGQRFWTNTAALNDADEIAATILMRPPAEGG